MSRAEAIKQLGKEDDYINLKGFNTERDIAQDTYNTNYNALQNKFNELLATADRNKVSAKTDFNSSRDVLNRNSYMSTRGKTGADLSSRGLSKGFGSGGKFVSNLQRNNASSTLANTYYDAMANIQRDIDKGTQDHNYNMETLKLGLDKTLADIGAREAAARNNYRAQVAQLAEQIQARYDANAYAQKQLDELVKQGYRDLGTKYSLVGETDVNKVMATAQLLMKEAGYDNVGDALKFLQQYGGLNTSAVQAATDASWEEFKKKHYYTTGTSVSPTAYNATSRKQSSTSTSKTNKYSGTNRGSYYDDKKRR